MFHWLLCGMTISMKNTKVAIVALSVLHNLKLYFKQNNINDNNINNSSNDNSYTFNEDDGSES